MLFESMLYDYIYAHTSKMTNALVKQGDDQVLDGEMVNMSQDRHRADEPVIVIEFNAHDSRA